MLDISKLKLATLKTLAGLNDNGGVQFHVLIDGKVKHETQVMHYGAVEPISLDVTGAKQIVLRVLNDGSGRNSFDSVAWGYPRFIQAGERPAGRTPDGTPLGDRRQRRAAVGRGPLAIGP